MACSKKQVRTLMKYSKTLSQEAAADKAGMSLRTARNYLKAGGQMGEAKDWKYRLTHKDAFSGVMPEVECMLAINPGLQAQTLMQWLIDQYPEEFNWSHKRTLERRISKWRALKGPDQEVMFRQELIAGKQSQSDWTHCTELEVMIDGQPFPHMLFHFMLPYSRWETAHISNSESFDNLTMGYMKSVAELGGVVKEHRTDNLTAAVVNHGNSHVFNERWAAFLSEEMAVMKALPARDWNDPKEVWPTVTSFSTISVDKVVYSVPSRLIGRSLKALAYPEVVRVFFGSEMVQEMPRLQPGSKKINYRHMVAHLMRKPGAFANYQYREEMFPSLIFRQAYDALSQGRLERADKEYLSLLNLAAMGSEQDVEVALAALLEAGQLPLFVTVRELVATECPSEVPSVFIAAPELVSYDLLLTYFASAPKEVH